MKLSKVFLGAAGLHAMFIVGTVLLGWCLPDVTLLLWFIGLADLPLTLLDQVFLPEPLGERLGLTGFCLVYLVLGSIWFGGLAELGWRGCWALDRKLRKSLN